MERLERRDYRFIAACLLVIVAGATVTSVLFLLTIVGVVVFLIRTRKDQPEPVRADL